MRLATFLDVALAEIQTTMIELEDKYGCGERTFPERELDAYLELEQAFARIKRARNLLS